jgi:hypothetical protein
MGLAAMQLDGAPRGTGDVGPASTRAANVRLPRAQTRRGRDDCARFGQFAVARRGSRTRGAPGRCPLEAQVNLPARGDSSVLQEWMTGCTVEPPCKDRAGVFEPLVARDRAESGVRAVAQEAPADDEDC